MGALVVPPCHHGDWHAVMTQSVPVPTPSLPFAASTHRRYWLFRSQSDLDHQRHVYHQKHAQSATHWSQQSHQSLPVVEELTLVQHYHCQLEVVGSLFEPALPPFVLNTAHLFLARFYCRHSVLHYHPKDAMLCCLMVACKVEEYHVPVERLAERACGSAENKESKAKAIVSLEVKIIEGCGFHLKCAQPHKAVRALVRSLQSRRPVTAAQECKALQSAALKLADKIYLTDGQLLFAHSQIALAAVTLAAREHVELKDVDVLSLLAAESAPAVPLSDVRDRVDLVISYIQTGRNLDEIAVKAAAGVIHRKLKKLFDPRFDPNTEEYAALERQRAEDKAMKKEQKMAARRQAELARQQELMGGSSPNERRGTDIEEFVVKRAKVSRSGGEDTSTADEERLRRAQQREELRHKHGDNSLI